MKQSIVVKMSILIALTLLVIVILILMLVASLPYSNIQSGQEKQADERNFIEDAGNFTPQSYTIRENGKVIRVTKLGPTRGYEKQVRNSSLAEHYCTPDEIVACDKIFDEILAEMGDMNVKELTRFSKGMEIIRPEGGIDDFWNLEGDLNGTTKQEKFKAIQNIGNLENYSNIIDLVKRVVIYNDGMAFIEIRGLSYLKDKSELEEINVNFTLKGKLKEFDGVGFVNGEKYVAQVKSLGLSDNLSDFKTLPDAAGWVNKNIKEQLDSIKSEIEAGNDAFSKVKRVKIIVPKSQYVFVLSDGRKVGEALDKIRGYSGYPFKIELEVIPESYVR